jgi:hypothetical protein
MMTFREFLQKKAEEQHQPQRRQRRDEWIEAVRRLITQLRAWLAEADPEKLLDVVPLVVERVEPGLGAYSIPSLKIGVGDATVEVVPIGRNALGFVNPSRGEGLRAEGRVDITDGVRKHILYRTLADGQETWHILNEQFESAPLDLGRLEAILQDLLS